MTEPATATEFLGAFGPRTVEKTLSNGLVIVVKKIDIPEVIGAGIEEIPLPGVELPPAKDGVQPLPKGSLPELKKKTKLWQNAMLIQGVESPKFIMGKDSFPEKNEIGVEDPIIPEKIKVEIRAHVMAHNGMEGPASDFFRILREEELAVARSTSEAL